MEFIEINEDLKGSLYNQRLSIDYNQYYNEKSNSSMSYDYFFTHYLLMNRPCIFHADITNAWPCARQWKLDNAPNFESLRRFYGNIEVPVADCKIKYYNAQLKKTMTIEKFMDYWEEYRNKNCPADMPVLYLKDWHCLRDNPNTMIYQVPKFFASDWLNEYYLAHPELADDYMFVYMGPTGSWTPLHVDVFTSYSWSANIVGKKRWLLFPPGEEQILHDGHGNLPYNIDAKDGNLVGDRGKRTLEIIQGPGEVIFIPSGWYHQVWNLEDTISINHNWINGCNILNVWKELKRSLLAVLKEIEDCSNMDNWHAHCQVMLKALHGMDYSQFYDFLSFIIEQRINTIDTNRACTSFGIWQLGLQHTLFDLQRAKEVLNYLIQDVNEKDIYYTIFLDARPENLIERIDSITAKIQSKSKN